MKITKTIPWLAVVSLLASCSFPPPRPPSPEERQRQFVSCFREEMQPTDEQVANLKERILNPDAATRKLGEELRKETEGLERLLETPSARDAELLERFHRVGALRDRMSEDHFRRMLLLRSILTDDQKKRFLACKRRMGAPAGPQE